MFIKSFFNEDFFATYQKVVNVVASCRTPEQLNVAKKMCKNFYNQQVHRKEFVQLVLVNIKLEHIIRKYYNELIKSIEEKEKSFYETYGSRLRNKLTPYKVLLGLIRQYKNGEITETTFKQMLEKNEFYDNIDDLIKFSKILDNFVYDKEEF